MGKKRILVVDDSQTVRQQVSLALAQAGFEVVEACDGEEGATVVDEQPDIAGIVCDVNMPRLNGIDMLERIRGSQKSANIPVLMLTTEGQPALIRKAKEVGAKGWMVKPFNATHLVAAIQKLTA
ncbi:MAG TPA: response regulator [Polyangiaceae bacterium]|nr:response regulator [Polyangiaceae bacterium]